MSIRARRVAGFGNADLAHGPFLAESLMFPLPIASHASLLVNQVNKATFPMGAESYNPSIESRRRHRDHRYLNNAFKDFSFAIATATSAEYSHARTTSSCAPKGLHHCIDDYAEKQLLRKLQRVLSDTGATLLDRIRGCMEAAEQQARRGMHTRIRGHSERARRR